MLLYREDHYLNMHDISFAEMTNNGIEQWNIIPMLVQKWGQTICSEKHCQKFSHMEGSKLIIEEENTAFIQA